MKLFIGTTLLLLLAGAPAFAGQEPEKDRPKEEPKKQEEPKQAPKKAPKQAPKQAEKPKQQPAAHQQDNNRAKPEEQHKAPQAKPAQHQDNRAQDQQHAKQTEQHSNNNAQHSNGRRIPEATYRSSFGSGHQFHVQRGSNRFNYGGFWFNYSQPWPGDWDYNDDVYVEEIDGQYYLINPHHPGVHLLVVVGD